METILTKTAAGNSDTLAEVDQKYLMFTSVKSPIKLQLFKVLNPFQMVYISDNESIFLA